jgi:dipeptidyl aminopeptidase/acylaminoacyl peptidase
MSPEQARGKLVDRRADIWAFGVVLHEMLTGERLFKGEDLTDTLAAVVRERPDISAAPYSVRKILEKCLEKDPKKRLRHISSFSLLLENSTSEQTITAPLQTKRRALWVSWIAAGVVGIAFAALAFTHYRETPPELRSVRFNLEAPPDAAFVNQYGSVSPSPDGRYVVFGAQARGAPQMLWLRPLDSMAMRPLPGTEGGNFPTWSPDSKSLAFLSGGKIKRIDIAGGAPLTLGVGGDYPPSTTGTWSADGVILYGSSDGLHRVSASGGSGALLTKVDPAKETGHGYPQFLPGGKRFLYFAASGDSHVQGVYVSSLDNPEKRQQVLRTSVKAVFVPGRGTIPDYLLWMQDQTLLAQRFKPDTVQLEGDPVSVAEGVGLNPNISIRAAFWASDAGVLTYFAYPATRKRSVVWIGRDGKQLSEVATADTITRVAIAPRADRIAVARLESNGGPPNLDIWVRELARGVLTRLTFDAASDDIPVWSPDGKQIAYVSNRDGGNYEIYRKDVSGAGPEERMTHSSPIKLVLDWSKDGRYILYREQNVSTGRDLMAIPLEGDRKPIAVVNTQFSESTGAISPDGRWVAYTSNDSGTNEIYIQSFPGIAGAPAGRWQVSSGGAYEVKWPGDGKEIFYQTQDGKVMASAIQASPQGIRVEQPRPLFSADFQRGGLHEFDVTSDGQRFLLILNPPTDMNTERLTVVSNWQAALRK